MSTFDDASALLHQLSGMLQSNPSAYPQIASVSQKLSVILQNCIDRMPLLSDTWSILHAKVTDWSERLSREAVNADSLAHLFAEAETILSYAAEHCDYYAQADPADGMWYIPHRHAGLSDRVLYNEAEYEKFWNMLSRGENFALARSADGEYAIMQGRSITAVRDYWSSPDYVTGLGHALLETLEITDDRFYFGVSCPCCDPAAHFFYKSHVKNQKAMTFSNIWANANYPRFADDFPTLTRDAVVIANHRGQGNSIGNLNILKYYPVSDDCFSFWDNEADRLISDVIHDFGGKRDLLYVVSAGPMSGPIIAALFKNNPDNTYVDFGSSISRYIHGQSIRDYMDGEVNSFSAKKCWMPKPQITPLPDVSVVLTLYKRPEVLEEQLEAVERQTLPPKEILLFQDVPPDGEPPCAIPSHLKERFSDIVVCSSNQGVWGRFEYARQHATGTYITLFDDDTIPGDRWLENCYMHMIQQSAIYVTIGVILRENAIYPDRDYFRIGWGAPYQSTTEADFGGHSWFITAQDLETMMKEGDILRREYKYLGEDMWLSCSNLTAHGTRTVVPAHCLFDTRLWGSIPDRAQLYGQQSHAISMQPEHLQCMTQVMQAIREKGWMQLRDRHNDYVEYLCEKTIGLGYNRYLNDQG